MKWFDDAEFYGSHKEQYMTLPDLDAGDCRETILEWDMQPGDARRGQAARRLVSDTLAQRDK